MRQNKKTNFIESESGSILLTTVVLTFTLSLVLISVSELVIDLANRNRSFNYRGGALYAVDSASEQSLYLLRQTAATLDGVASQSLNNYFFLGQKETRAIKTVSEITKTLLAQKSDMSFDLYDFDPTITGYLRISGTVPNSLKSQNVLRVVRYEKMLAGTRKSYTTNITAKTLKAGPVEVALTGPTAGSYVAVQIKALAVSVAGYAGVSNFKVVFLDSGHAATTIPSLEATGQYLTAKKIGQVLLSY